MAKEKKNNNLDYIITKLKNSIGNIRVIEHKDGISFGGIHEVSTSKNTLTIINENGLEKIQQAEKNNSSTSSIYTDSNCIEVLDLNSIFKVK